jgi:CRISPR/Cas system CSM-associated protein Csm2 small subunit
VASKIPYVYDYITKLHKAQAELILNHVNQMYMVLDKEKQRTKRIKGLNLAVVRPTTVQLTKYSLRVIK